MGYFDWIKELFGDDYPDWAEDLRGKGTLEDEFHKDALKDALKDDIPDWVEGRRGKVTLKGELLKDALKDGLKEDYDNDDYDVYGMPFYWWL